MIKFNNVSLEDIAPVKIDDIRVSPIQTAPIARQKINGGQDFIRMEKASRTVVITFALLNEDIQERYQDIQKIVEWAQPYTEGNLSLPMYDDKHLECLCTGYPAPSYRQWWEGSLSLVFTTFENPYWTSDDEIRAQCGQQFTVGGTASPVMRIERNLTSRVANQTYASGGKSMFFDQIPAGNLLIDLNRQTAEVSGTSIMQHFGKTSKFIEPRTGNITITGIGTVIYRERWV